MIRIALVAWILGIGSLALAQEPAGSLTIPLRTGPLTLAPAQPIARGPSAAAPPAAAPGPPRARRSRPASASGGPITAAARYIVKFRSLPSEAETAALAGAGLAIHDYTGTNSYYVTASRPIAEITARFASIEGVAPLSPAVKMHPDLQRPARPDAAAINLPIAIRAFPGTDLDVLSGQIAARGGSILRVNRTTLTLGATLPRARLTDFAELNDVMMLEPAAPQRRRFNDLVRERVGATIVAEPPYGLTGAGVTVGIWDEGVVAAAHPDLAGRVTVVSQGVPEHLHPTHVAGTLGGDGRGSLAAGPETSHSTSPVGALGAARDGLVPQAGGAAFQWKGIASGVRMVSFDWANAVDMHEVAIHRHGIHVSQNSWGSTVAGDDCGLFGQYTLEAEEFDRIVVGFFGRPIPVVFAAGNARNDRDCGLSPDPPFLNYRVIPPPITAKNVIAVGAVNSDDDGMTNFSSWGPTADGRLKPDLVAPGCRRGGQQAIFSAAPPARYRGLCGTSVAAPVVSGAIALMIEQHEKFGAGPPLLPSTIKAALVHGAIDIEPPGPDYRNGYGRLSIRSSVDLIRSRSFAEGVIRAGTDSSIREIAVAAGATELKATLAWDDAPASTNAPVSLVNDLELRLISPQGTEHRPLVLDPNRPDKPSEPGSDHINVVEQALVRQPIAGSWKIRITAASLPKAPQTFAIITSVK
ncbi:S8 family serine peptidase [uncultured Enterovirga sp.]|uniref:S8 family serine peptidase n=1 Tax=uncultured Enterovirga sp. TaxID=2026352 RepID=UPI0035CB2161